MVRYYKLDHSCLLLESVLFWLAHDLRTISHLILSRSRRPRDVAA